MFSSSHGPQHAASGVIIPIGLSDADSEDTLGDAAEREREYLKRQLRDELGREPTEEELNEWLRRHTEGY